MSINHWDEQNAEGKADRLALGITGDMGAASNVPHSFTESAIINLLSSPVCRVCGRLEPARVHHGYVHPKYRPIGRQESGEDI